MDHPPVAYFQDISWKLTWHGVNSIFYFPQVLATHFHGDSPFWPSVVHVKKKVVYDFKFYAYIFTDMVSLFVFKSEKYFLLPK